MGIPPSCHETAWSKQPVSGTSIRTEIEWVSEGRLWPPGEKSRVWILSSSEDVKTCAQSSGHWPLRWVSNFNLLKLFV